MLENIFSPSNDLTDDHMMFEQLHADWKTHVFQNIHTSCCNTSHMHIHTGWITVSIAVMLQQLISEQVGSQLNTLL